MKTTNNKNVANIENLATHDFFRIDYEPEKLVFKKYFADCEKKILKIINKEGPTSSKFINFVSEMNSGKTYSIIDIACRNNLKMIILEPLQIIALQKHKEYLKNNPETLGLGLVHGQLSKNARNTTVNVDEISAMLTNEMNVFLCIYNSLEKFFDQRLYELFDFSEYILVIDECHNMVTEYSYRNEVINFISDISPKFKKVINLTGTPEGAINKKYPSYFFRKEIPDLVQKELNIVRYDGDNLYCLLNLLLNDKNPGLKVILIDDINKLKLVVTALVKKLNNPAKVRILSSALKNSIDYINLIEYEEIDPDVEFLFTTRVISDGGNIKNNVASVYLVDMNNNYWVKRQFLARFRNKIDNVYELRSNTGQANINFDDLTKFATGKIEECERKLPDLMNDFRNDRMMNNGLTKHKFIKKKEDHIYYSSMENKFKISNESIVNKQIDFINRKLERSIEHTKQFYLELGNYTVNIVEYKDLVDTEITQDEYNELIGVISVKLISKDPSILKKWFKELFAAYCSELPIAKVMHKQILNVVNNNLINENLDLSRYKDCFRDSKSLSYMEEAYNFIMSGYPERVVIELLQLKFSNRRKYNSLIRKLDFLSGYKIVEKLKDFNIEMNHVEFEKDFILPYKFYLYHCDFKRMTNEERAVGLSECKNYDESLDKAKYIENLNALFKISILNNARVNDYVKEGKQSLTSLLEDEGIILTTDDTIAISQMPYMRLCNKVDHIINIDQLCDKASLLSLKSSVEQFSGIELNLQKNHVTDQYPKNLHSFEGVEIMNLSGIELRELPKAEIP